MTGQHVRPLPVDNALSGCWVYFGMARIYNIFFP